jgi:hypothetical protein
MISSVFVHDSSRFYMTSKTAQAAILIAVCMLIAAVPAVAQSSIDVVGLDGRTTAVSFAGLERKTVATADRAGIKTIHEGVALRDVLAKAGAPLGDALKGKALAQAVVATAADGYQVVYAIAEIDAAFNAHVILVADRRNGQPLLPDSGPLQIIVPQDNRQARWIRQVRTLEVRQLQ